MGFPQSLSGNQIRIFLNTMQFLFFIFAVCQMFQIIRGSLSKDPNDLRYLLFREREKSTFVDPKDKNSWSHINNAQPLVVLIDGFTSNVSTEMSEETKNAFFDKFSVGKKTIDQNLIILDWSKLNGHGSPLNATLLGVYWDVVSSTKTILGSPIAEFLCSLKKEKQIGDIHLVGHSLGGQLIGYIGVEFTKKCGVKIQVLTALDAARPGYELGNPILSDPNAANVVQVIHTNGGMMGVLNATGTTNLYINGGLLQPGCPKVEITFDLLKFLTSAANSLMCHHSFSHRFFRMTMKTSSVGCSCKPSNCLSSSFPTCPNPVQVGYGMTTIGSFNVNAPPLPNP